MNKCILALVVFLPLMSVSVKADVIDDLRALKHSARDYRELTVDCLVEVKLFKAKGWGSSECEKYEEFSKKSLHEFKAEVKGTTQEFVASVRKKELSMRRTKRGMKYLMIIKSNSENISTLSKGIKLAVKK